MVEAGDPVGGLIEGVARGLPVGWGDPVFDRLEADLAKAMLSLPASKGFEVGSGFGDDGDSGGGGHGNSPSGVVSITFPDGSVFRPIARAR